MISLVMVMGGGGNEREREREVDVTYHFRSPWLSVHVTQLKSFAASRVSSFDEVDMVLSARAMVLSLSRPKWEGAAEVRAAEMMAHKREKRALCLIVTLLSQIVG